MSAFRGCTALRDVVIGKGVASIGFGAFCDCTDIAEVTSYIEEPFSYHAPAGTVGMDCFPDEVYETAMLRVPLGTKEKYEAVSEWNHFKNIIEIGSHLDGISQATQDCPASTNDLQGRRLTGRPSRGLYIRDGKKVVIK